MYVCMYVYIYIDHTNNNDSNNDNNNNKCYYIYIYTCCFQEPVLLVWGFVVAGLGQVRKKRVIPLVALMCSPITVPKIQSHP